MPSAITSTAINENPGDRVNVRAAYFKSRQALSMAVNVFCRHKFSRTTCGLPNFTYARLFASSGDIPRATFSSVSSAM
jgi:hypothetical protein